MNIDEYIDCGFLRDLVEIGFFALSLPRALDAQIIFEAVGAARPEEEAPQLGRALVCLSLGEPEDAVTVLHAMPQTEAVRSFLAIACLLCGRRDEAHVHLLRLMQDGASDSPFVQLARETYEASAEAGLISSSGGSGRRFGHDHND